MRVQRHLAFKNQVRVPRNRSPRLGDVALGAVAGNVKFIPTYGGSIDTGSGVVTSLEKSRLAQRISFGLFFDF